MGLLRKGRKSADSDGGSGSGVPDDTTRAALAAELIAGTGAPYQALGYVVLVLLQSGAVNGSHLERLGLSEDEIVAMFAAYSESGSTDELAYELEVRAATRRYDRDLLVIALRRGIEPDSPEFTAFRSAVAEFAIENEITNIDAAYRLMLAECPDRLPKGRTLDPSDPSSWPPPKL